jgi:predicted O-methyltransferase YrrM
LGVYFFNMNGWLEYIKYKYKSSNLHGVHSPFIYDLLEKVIQDKTIFKEYAAIEDIKSALIKNQSELTFYDHGAQKGEKQTTISKLASNSGVSQKYGRLLFRLTRWFQPKYVLELGTSLGIGTLYLSMGCGIDAEIFSLEGGESIADIAKQNFKKANLYQDVFVKVGPIEETLNEVLLEMPQIDFAYFDANHRLVPTLQYFEICLAKAHENTVFIFDDINWSKEMRDAWHIIKQHPKTKVAVDLYRFGMVFFKTNQAKEDFILRF